jgi:hypothetical protein
MAMSELPPGFVLDQPVDTGLPAGFVMDKPSALEDAGKSVASGLGNAAISTLGMGGDVRSLLGAGVDAAGRKLGFDGSKVRQTASTIANMTPLVGINNAPTSQQLKDSAPDALVSPDYQPQTTFGGYLKTGAEMAPNLLLGRGGIVPRMLTDVAAPAIASETAGLMTKGTDAEPYARMGWALLGGAGANKFANAMTEAKALKAATPALSDVKSEATNAYDAMTSRNVATPLAQSTLTNLADDITLTLNNKGIRPSTAQAIHNAVDEIRSPATAGAADVADLVAARQNVKGLLGSPDANKAGAFVALGKIESAIEQASPGTMTKIREADKNYAALRANEALDKKVARADLRAAGADSGMNVGNKIRQKVADLLLSNDAKFLSAETKAELEKIVRGTWTQNGMRMVSNMMGGGGGIGSTVVGLGAMGAGGATGHPELGLLPLGGLGLRFATNRSVGRQAIQTAEAIRRRSPLGQQTPPTLPPMSNPALSGLVPALLARPQQ